MKNLAGKKLTKPKKIALYVIAGILLGSSLILLSDHSAQIGLDDRDSQLIQKLSITLLLFPNYTDKVTFIDPIKNSLMLFLKFSEFQFTEIVANVSYKSYRNLAFLRGDSVLLDPQGSPDEYIIPITAVHSIDTESFTPRIHFDIPKSVYRALEEAPFVRAIDWGDEATFYGAVDP
ncbi:MAG: hypothetical protein ACTSWW_06615, partial [Promethearchaeota archaeon]